MKSDFIYKITNLIFRDSNIFDKFRNIVHNNFKDEKAVISKNFDRNKRTLDFGCGAGQFSVLFNQDKYYGVDTDIKYIKFCKLNHKGNFSLIKNSPPYKFKSKYFDQILVSAVIHHIDDKVLIKIAKELNRILKANGELMVIDHFIKKNQRNLICKLLIDLDRGKHFRDADKARILFSKYFKIKKVEFFKNSVYKDYTLILNKK
jgi:SAM-dependent methyltransferase